ncbi:MAG: FecR domain-containing protein [Myxococcales bacterium]|nr:FecR domain-containing protein [Myxococcales bacterium]
MKDFTKKYTEALEKQGAQAGKKSDAEVLARARAHFAEKLHGVDTPAPSPWRFLVPALSAAAAAAVVAFLAWPETPLSVTVRGQPGTTADFVLAQAGDEALDFSDGTEVLLRRDSQLRVTQVTAHGADVLLEKGAAHVAVVHRDKQTRWNFVAGPYRVAVVGTRFELRWNPETGGLEVEMDEGIVEVDGPGLSRQRVTTQQKLEAFSNPPRASLYLETPPALADATRQVTPPSVRVLPKERPAPAAAAPEKPRAQGPTWRYLAEKGDAQGAMQAADEAGFGWLTKSLPKADVLLLGDTARKARQPAYAREAWLQVRERFPGTRAATDAAIRLGDLAANVEHDDARAVKWFALAVKEAPNADTAPDAMGRWLDVLVRARKQGEAKQVAADYVKRFPNGAKVAEARELLQ